MARNCYNARSETVAEKPSFRAAWKASRFCLIPLQAFYEPRYGEDGKAVRWRISRKDGEPFAAAGIWGWWNHPANGERIESFSMLTINADEHSLMRQFHKPEDEKRSFFYPLRNINSGCRLKKLSWRAITSLTLIRTGTKLALSRSRREQSPRPKQDSSR